MAKHDVAKHAGENARVTSGDDTSGKSARSGKASNPKKAIALSAQEVNFVPESPIQAEVAPESPAIQEPETNMPGQTAAPESMAPVSLSPEKPGGPGWGALLAATLLAAVLGGILGAGGTYEVQQYLGIRPPSPPLPSPPLPSVSPPQLIALESRVAALDQAIRAAAPRVELQDLATRAELAELAGKMASTSSPSTAGATISGATPAELQALADRVAKAEAASAQAAQGLQAALPRLASVETATRALGTPSMQAAGAVQLLLSERVRQSLESGRPFAADLKALGAAGIAETALQPLQAVATRGAATTTWMRDELRRQRRVLTQENNAQPASWSDQAVALASRIVTVQKLDGPASMSPPALVARMDAALEAGNAAGALAAWQALPEPARRASEALGASLAQRAGAESAIRAIGEAAVQALAAPAAR